MKTIAIDWEHDDKTGKAKATNYDGEKVRKKAYKPKQGDMVVTENMPEKECKKMLDKGVQIMRCGTHVTRKRRERDDIEKSDENDAIILHEVFKETPNEFYVYRWHPDLAELKSAYKSFDDVKQMRVTNSNRKWAAGGELQEKVVKELEVMEKARIKDLKTVLQRLPIYTEFLAKIPGIAERNAAELLSHYGDPLRFKKVYQMQKYFGLDVQDGAAPKKRRGHPASWSHKGRACILGHIGDCFIKVRKCPYRKAYDDFKEDYAKKEREKENDPEAKGIKGHVHNKALRKACKLFMKHFFQAYKEYPLP